jgi:hypothetical protein
MQEIGNGAMGNVDYSPEVDLAKKKRRLWKEVVKKREGHPVSAAMIKRKARQCGIQCPLSVTLVSILPTSSYEEISSNEPTFSGRCLRSKDCLKYALNAIELCHIGCNSMG